MLRSQGVCVHSVHRARTPDGHKRGVGLFGNEVLNYLAVVEMEDVYFNVGQRAREGIASGKTSKTPMASADGVLLERRADVSYAGVEIRFNPVSMHLFCDNEGYAVHSADRVTVLGHRIYARGTIRYYTEENAPKRMGNAPSNARFKTVSRTLTPGFPVLAQASTERLRQASFFL